jgi:general secretion pathway protein C
MDIAHQLATLRAQPSGELLKSANRYLPPAVTLVLLAVVAYLAAQLTWRLVPTPSAAPLAAIATPGVAGGPSGGAFAAQEIVARHPFGVAALQDTRPSIPISNAPETTQPLKLMGVVLNGEAEDGKGFAMISTNNREAYNYRVGESVQHVNGVRVVELFKLEVLLNVNGRTEKLTFCGATGPARGDCKPLTAMATRTPTPAAQVPLTVPTASRQSAGGDNARQLIESNAQRLTDIVRLSGIQTQDGLTGYQVTSGRDRETFEALGFKDNDVVLNINGAPLTNPQDGVKLMDALADTNTATVTVLRDGAQHSISLDTTRLRSILENRE